MKSQTTLYYEDKEKFNELLDFLKEHFNVKKNSDAIMRALELFPSILNQKEQYLKNWSETENKLNDLKEDVKDYFSIQNRLKNAI